MKNTNFFLFFIKQNRSKYYMIALSNNLYHRLRPLKKYVSLLSHVKKYGLSVGILILTLKKFYW